MCVQSIAPFRYSENFNIVKYHVALHASQSMLLAVSALQHC